MTYPLMSNWIRKKRYTERLRDNAQMSIEMAITDALTGLHNRRYMETHIGTLVEQALVRGNPLTVLVGPGDDFNRDRGGHRRGKRCKRHQARRSAPLSCKA
jgi:two-component system cell cycle response regulator